MKHKSTITTLTLMTILTLSACSIIGAAQPSLDETAWVLTEIDGTVPLPGSSVTLRFADGQVSGNSSCNSYGGDYTTSSSGSIEFGMMMSTLMACMEPEGLMEQETAYMQTLSEVESFQVDGSELTLEDGSGMVLLRYEQVSAD